MKLAILGAGAWGTALGIALCAAHRVTLWGRDRAQVERMTAERINARYLPGYSIPPAVVFTNDLQVALTDSDLAIAVTPTRSLRETLAEVARLAPHRPVVWGCKGLEPGTRKLPHEIAREELGEHGHGAVLSGPSFAQEVASGLPAALTLACADAPFAVDTARALHSTRLRVYSSVDVIGVEVGGAIKNVMAIAAGICDGMGLGMNARAALITRGLAEVTRLGVKLGGQPETFMGLTGLGDLVLTCTGDLSRNRQVGLQLAQGDKLATVLARLGHVAEGVSTAREVAELAQAHGVDMPITNAVCKVLYDDIPAEQALEELLRREPKPEAVGR